MRTPYLHAFREQLSELNNAFSHYTFVWEQFYIDNSAIIDASPGELTSTVYAANTAAGQFNVRLDHLRSSHQHTYDVILKSLFILSYAEFEVYLRSLYQFLRKVNPSLEDLDKRAQLPEDVLVAAGLTPDDALNEAELQTFAYLRLRRNRLMHSGGIAKGELAEIIRQKGTMLTRYWSQQLVNGLYGLDFKNQETEQFKKEEVFDLINIWRSLTTKLDDLLLKTISRPDMIQYFQERFVEHFGNRLKPWTLDRKRSRFSGFIKKEMGIDLHSAEIDALQFNGNVA